MTVSVARKGVGGFLCRVAFAVAASLLGSTAAGQVQPVTAYYAVITADDTPLRSGDKEVLYPVARLNKGTLVRVDGQGAGWVRVTYPAGVPCCVGADSIQIDAGSKSGTLTKESRLKAFNITSGYKGSWNSVLDKPAPAGTKVVLAETDPVNDGRGNAGYKIVPPEAARAFLQESVIVRATQSQIDAYVATIAPKDQPKTPEKPIKQADAPVTPDNGTKIADGGKPADHQAKPADGQQPVAPNDANKVVEAPKSPYEKLEAAFEAVRKQPVESAEFTALMGEFQAAIDKLDDSPQNSTIKRRLAQRLEYLKLQTDIQAAARRVQESKQELNEAELKLADRMKEVEKSRQYTIVGRLSASTVYDGKRLPLMFRIMAIGGQSSRTLAYVKPDDKLKLETKIGSVVGVLGESRLDPTLKSNVITPVRVDVLEAAPTLSIGPAEPAPAAEVPDKN